MFRRLKALFTLALLLGSAAAYCAVGPDDPPGRVARLNYAAGTVSFAPYEAPDSWVQAVVNRPLTSGDRLWADQTGRAELHVGSTAIRLGALTSADILNLDDQTLQLRLAQGTLNVRVRDLAPGEIVEIATPAGAVLLRQPGSYRISADPSGASARVLVTFGQAEIVTPTQTFSVPSSQAASLTAGGPVQFEVAAYASADEFDRWSADRDRREDNSQSARYVSRDMTGYEDLDRYGAWQTMPEYGAVWIPRVASGWAPYRYGHWVWVSPWGWTWVDDAPWGYAPSHYGRWVYVNNYWAWAPGPVVRRPVYAPALVAFVGGSNFSVSVRSGPSVGWFPLGWREPYIPSYRASPAYVRNVNVTHVTNVTNITNVTNVRYVNRERPEAVTVVPQQTFVSARPVGQSHVAATRNELARAEIVRDRSPAEPVRASVGHERRGERPPATVAAREVVSVSAPAAAPGGEGPTWRERPAFSPRGNESEPRVRVLRQERERVQGQPTATAPAVAPATAAPAASAPAVAAPAAAAPAAAPAAAERRERAEDRRDAVIERRNAAPDRRDASVERRSVTPERREAAAERREAVIERRNAAGAPPSAGPQTPAVARTEPPHPPRESAARETPPAQVYSTPPREAQRPRPQQAEAARPPEQRAPEHRTNPPPPPQQHREAARPAPAPAPAQGPSPEQQRQQRARQGDG